MSNLIAFVAGLGLCAYISKTRSRIKDLEAELAIAKKENAKAEA